MSLSPGTRISTYDVVAQIGEGGMGVVYRAHDTKLGRDIALKLLPDAFAMDAERLARFEREARTLATLNHPNIAQVYDAGKDPSGAYLVMELVEGETLGEAIRRRHASAPSASTSTSSSADLLDWSLPIAKQIVDALEAAHEQGVIHRDLKPANIKVRPDGAVKVLDFGLAKAMDSSGSANPNVSHSPTLTHQGTMAGMILGTAAYMAPEQARGRAVDRRADIWAFGVVLYEMLAGRRAFEGEDVSITLAGVLKEDVNWAALPEDLPASWRRLLRRCLEKDPKRRLSAIADARLDLDESEAPGADARTASTPKDVARAAELAAAHAAELARISKQKRAAWFAAGTASLLGVVALAALFWPRPQPAPPPRVAFSLAVVAPTDGVIFPAVSSDGQRLSYLSPRESGGPSVIWVRPLGGEEARPLAGTEGATQLTWSPDSRSVAFVASGRVSVAHESGGVVRLAEVPSPAGLTWLPNGDVLAASNTGGPGKLFRVPAQGGPASELTLPKVDGAGGAYSLPQILPGGQRFLYLGWSSASDQRALFVGSLDGAAPVRIVASETGGAFADGHLFFTRDRALFAQPFDPSTQRLSGEALRLVDDLATSNVRAGFAVSEAGVLVYRQGAAGLGSDLAWFDRTGRALGTAGDGGTINQLRLSRDGRRVALTESRAGASSRLSVLELSNGISSAMNTTHTGVSDPVWSPDGQTLAYGAMHDGALQLFTQEIGGPAARLAYQSADRKPLSDWSADGQWLLFHLMTPSKLYAVKPGDPSSLKLLLDTPETIDGAHFSPDGKWIAYQITEAGVYNVWVASFPAFDQRRQVSRQGGGQAMWRSDGRELFYLTPQGKMMSVRTTPTATGGLEISPPAELFQTPLAPPRLVLDQYSVTADGQRFLILRPRGSSTATQTLRVVVNWREP
jgi:eukaryotic-like serine/threonine-protein kinase